MLPLKAGMLPDNFMKFWRCIPVIIALFSWFEPLKVKKKEEVVAATQLDHNASRRIIDSDQRFAEKIITLYILLILTGPTACNHKVFLCRLIIENNDLLYL
jgi:hypothetical protein